MKRILPITPSPPYIPPYCSFFPDVTHVRPPLLFLYCRWQKLCQFQFRQRQKMVSGSHSLLKLLSCMKCPSNLKHLQFRCKGQTHKRNSGSCLSTTGGHTSQTRSFMILIITFSMAPWFVVTAVRFDACLWRIDAYLCLFECFVWCPGIPGTLAWSHWLAPLCLLLMCCKNSVTLGCNPSPWLWMVWHVDIAVINGLSIL